MISAVVIAKNEEKNIKRCLSHLQFCDEVIVIDDDSNDDTVKIAKKMGAKVYSRPLDRDFASQRNIGINKATKRWVLFVDADEVVTKKLADETVKRLKNGPFEMGFYLERKDIIWGHKFNYGESGNIKLLRLARKGAGKWRRDVHETWEVRGKKGHLKSELLHYPHQNMTQFIKSVNKFSGLHAGVNYKEGKRSGVLKVVVWPVGHFIYNFVIRLGFLDGIYGFIYASVMSFHSYLSWSKLFIIQKKTL